MPDSTADHEHVLLSCPDCGGERTPDCIGCGGRGYVEVVTYVEHKEQEMRVCAICREPMGNRRRKWKREDTDA